MTRPGARRAVRLRLLPPLGDDVWALSVLLSYSKGTLSPNSRALSEEKVPRIVRDRSTEI